MTTDAPRTPSPEPVVVEALLALHQSTEHPFAFNSTWITTPVHETLAAHRWYPRRTAIGRFFRRLVGARD